MKISLFDSPNRVDVAVANAQRARAAGLTTYWTNQVMAADPMVVLGVVAAQVPDIALGTSVMAMQTMLPQTMAQQALTVNQVSGGRLTLGLGVSHQPVVTGMWGLAWDKPYSRLVEYLDALIPLLHDKRVSVTGTYVTQRTQLSLPADPPDLMLAALGPKMLRLAGERSSGTVTWMTGPNTIRDHIRPHLGAASIVAGVGVVVTDDVDAARARVNEALAIYPNLPSYKAVMDREGAVEAADLVLIGDAETVREGTRRYADSTTDEIAFNLMGTPDENDAAWELLPSLLG